MTSSAVKSQRIRAVVRVRPLLPFESSHTSDLLAVGPRLGDGRAGQNIALHPKKSVGGPDQAGKEFRVDAVFTVKSTQQEVFDGCNIKSMVAAVCKGYNATVFVYGQTGSGKTFTMEGLEYQSVRQTQSDGGVRSVIKPNFETETAKLGVMPRTITALFQTIELLQRSSVDSGEEPRVYRVRVSYVQIYNEQVYDLLNPGHIPAHAAIAKGGRVPGLRVRWTKDDDFYVENLFLCECGRPEEVMTLLQTGLRRKIMAAHSMNASSSRSHCIFQLHVDSFAVSRPAEVLSSMFSLVDLAGSERVSRTHATGMTLKESIAINKSLFVLRNVIKALATASGATLDDDIIEGEDEGGEEGKKAGPAVAHFRDSKLTSLLKHSLGGNSLTLMIACISSSDVYWEENKSTLLYAALAQKISNSLTVNEDPRTRVIKELQREIAILKEEICQLRLAAVCGNCGSELSRLMLDSATTTASGTGSGAKSTGLHGLYVENEAKLAKLDAENTTLSLENQQLREKVEILEYLLGRSETDGDTHTTPSSAPSGEQVVPALGRGTVVSFASQRSLSSSVLPLSTTGKLLGARLPPLSSHGFDAAALLEEDGHVDLGIDAAQAMSELTQLLKARAGLRKQQRSDP